MSESIRYLNVPTVEHTKDGVVTRTPRPHTTYVVQYRGSFDELVVLVTESENKAVLEAERLARHYDRVVNDSYEAERAAADAAGTPVPSLPEVPWDRHDPRVRAVAEIFSVDTSTYHNISVLKCVDGRPVSIELYGGE